MSKTETTKAEAATNSGAAAKVTDLGLLEEDDEFEEFPVEDEGTEELEQARVWEDNWDDDTIEDDFSNQLRTMSSETAPMSRSPPPLTPPPSKKRCVQTTPPPTKTPSATKQDKTENTSNGTATNGNNSTDSHAAKNGSSSPVSTPTKGRRGGRGSNSSQRNGTSSPEPAAAPSTPTRASTRLRKK